MVIIKHFPIKVKRFKINLIKKYFNIIDKEKFNFN